MHESTHVKKRVCFFVFFKKYFHKINVSEKRSKMKFERTKKEAKCRKKFEPERERYEREEREEREKREEEEKREWCERQKQYKINVLSKQFLYIEKVYGKNCINRKLARMNRDEYEIYKARKYVRNENANGHECYNGVEGKKLWINREMWKNMHDRK